MKRACLLSILLLVSMTTVLPLLYSAEHEAEAAARMSRGRRHRQMSAKQYRAWLRRKRARARRRTLALIRARERRRRALLAAARLRATPAGQWPTSSSVPFVRRPFMMNADASRAMNPYAMRAPDNWQRDSLSVNGEARFSMQGPDGHRTGVAAFVPLPAASLAAINPGASRSAAGRNQIGGVSFATLRRTVIDKMIEERGWVYNDLEREIGGRRVFVVLAQTADQQAWLYYFTELNGQVHRLAVKTPVATASVATVQAEQFLASLRATNQQIIAADAPRQ